MQHSRLNSSSSDPSFTQSSIQSSINQQQGVAHPTASTEMPRADSDSALLRARHLDDRSSHLDQDSAPTAKRQRVEGMQYETMKQPSGLSARALQASRPLTAVPPVTAVGGEREHQKALLDVVGTEGVASEIAQYLPGRLTDLFRLSAVSRDFAAALPRIADIQPITSFINHCKAGLTLGNRHAVSKQVSSEQHQFPQQLTRHQAMRGAKQLFDESAKPIRLAELHSSRRPTETEPAPQLDQRYRMLTLYNHTNQLSLRTLMAQYLLAPFTVEQPRQQIELAYPVIQSYLAYAQSEPQMIDAIVSIAKQNLHSDLMPQLLLSLCPFAEHPAIVDLVDRSFDDQVHENVHQAAAVLVEQSDKLSNEFAADLSFLIQQETGAEATHTLCRIAGRFVNKDSALRVQMLKLFRDHNNSSVLREAILAGLGMVTQEDSEVRQLAMDAIHSKNEPDTDIREMAANQLKFCQPLADLPPTYLIDAFQNERQGNVKAALLELSYYLSYQPEIRHWLQGIVDNSQDVGERMMAIDALKLVLNTHSDIVDRFLATIKSVNWRRADDVDTAMLQVVFEASLSPGASEQYVDEVCKLIHKVISTAPADLALVAIKYLKSLPIDAKSLEILFHVRFSKDEAPGEQLDLISELLRLVFLTRMSVSDMKHLGVVPKLTHFLGTFSSLPLDQQLDVLSHGSEVMREFPELMWKGGRKGRVAVHAGVSQKSILSQWANLALQVIQNSPHNPQTQLLNETLYEFISTAIQGDVDQRGSLINRCMQTFEKIGDCPMRLPLLFVVLDTCQAQQGSQTQESRVLLHDWVERQLSDPVTQSQIERSLIQQKKAPILMSLLNGSTMSESKLSALLERLLSSPHSEIRAAAINALLYSANSTVREAVAPTLLERLKFDPDMNIRGLIYSGLTSHLVEESDVWVPDVMVAMENESDAIVEREAVRALSSAMDAYVNIKQPKALR